MQTEDRAKEIIEDALRPFQCDFDPMGFDLILIFTITNQDGELVYPHDVGLALEEWGDDRELCDKLEEIRIQLKDMEHPPDPSWEYPDEP